jgi:cation diffusion facilitator CzcD-associated flavoprotein CzcO
MILDVVIVGAGISGISAAYRIRERNPGLRYVILERRESIGGTWDLFRYPGIRSDSSVYSLSFPWEPWTRPEGIADGDHIREYMIDAARKHGIYRNIRFNSYVRSVDWDSSTDAWTVSTDDGTTYESRFVFFATGYYNYDEGYTPAFPGMKNYTGDVVHPQHWPESLDFTDKTMVVIGSGATAVSMIPALAERAEKVIMLQRTPSYIAAFPRTGSLTEGLRKLLPSSVFHKIVRFLMSLREAIVWLLARKTPTLMKYLFRRTQAKRLPSGYDIDTHLRPPYDPWDQRICLDADGDLFDAINAGRVEMVTDHVDHFDSSGVVLRSGTHLDADIIVTATGMDLQALGGVALSLDSAEIKPQDRFVYKAHMLEDVPNLFWCIGYTNASWTLRADMTARATAKMIAYMRARGYTSAYPHLDGKPMPEKLSWDIAAGYVLRNLHAMPKSGTKRPWNVRQNYFADAIDYRFDRITEAMVFGSMG